MNQSDVLQALAGLEVDGIDPLRDGYVQDVAIEHHGDTAYIGIHVDDLWAGARPSDAAMEAMRVRVLGLAGVGAARIIPRSREDAEKARDAARRRRPARRGPTLPSGTSYVAVQSGKGGVGKSTVAVNLAAALARQGVRTALLDCDIYGFSVPTLLGVDRLPVAEKGKLRPPRVQGIEVMSMDFFVRQNQPVMWRGPMLGKALRQMTEETDWSDPQVMVLDLPPGTGDVAMDVHAFFPAAHVLVVTTPDPAAARVAVRAGQMARQIGHRLTGIVENLTQARCPECGHEQAFWGAGGGDLVARALQVPVLARVPWHPAAVGSECAVIPEDSEAGRVYAALASTVAGAIAQAAGGSEPKPDHPGDRTPAEARIGEQN